MAQEGAIVVGIVAGSAVGGLARYWLGGSIDAATGGTFPWGTLAVNIIGSLAIGIVAATTGPDGRFLVSPLVRQTIMVGVLGGFTTFSSFSLQTLLLARQSEWMYAVANVGLSLMLCLMAVWTGWLLGLTVNR